MRSAVIAIVFALGLFAGAARADELVVIDSTAPALAEGTVVDSTQELHLPAGTRITLMAASGEKQRIDGPFSGKPPSGAKGGDSKLVAAVARLLAPQAKDTTKLGAFRGSIGKSLQGPDTIDAARGGDFCVLKGMPPKFRRGLPAPAPEWAKLTAIKEGTDGEVAWPAGTALADWPSTVPMAESARYMLNRARAQPVRIVLHLEPAGLSLAARLDWMAGKGCREQAVQLVDQLP